MKFEVTFRFGFVLNIYSSTPDTLAQMTAFSMQRRWFPDHDTRHPCGGHLFPIWCARNLFSWLPGYVWNASCHILGYSSPPEWRRSEGAEKREGKGAEGKDKRKTSCTTNILGTESTLKSNVATLSSRLSFWRLSRKPTTTLELPGFLAVGTTLRVRLPTRCLGYTCPTAQSEATVFSRSCRSFIAVDNTCCQDIQWRRSFVTRNVHTELLNFAYWFFHGRLFLDIEPLFRFRICVSSLFLCSSIYLYKSGH